MTQNIYKLVFIVLNIDKGNSVSEVLLYKLVFGNTLTVKSMCLGWFNRTAKKRKNKNKIIVIEYTKQVMTYIVTHSSLTSAEPVPEPWCLLASSLQFIY